VIYEVVHRGEAAFVGLLHAVDRTFLINVEERDLEQEAVIGHTDQHIFIVLG
jgi:hypothetical protein